MTDNNDIVTVTGNQTHTRVFRVDDNCRRPKKVIQHRCSCGRTIKITIEEEEQ